jgi:hypothetical protein
MSIEYSVEIRLPTYNKKWINVLKQEGKILGHKEVSERFWNLLNQNKEEWTLFYNSLGKKLANLALQDWGVEDEELVINFFISIESYKVAEALAAIVIMEYEDAYTVAYSELDEFIYDDDGKKWQVGQGYYKDNNGKIATSSFPQIDK